MWILFGLGSAIFTLATFIFALKGRKETLYGFLCSLSFTALTVLEQYSMVGRWVRQEDWSSLMDVAPTMSSILTVYTIFMIGIHVAAICVYHKAKKAA